MAFFGSVIHTIESFLFPDRCAGGCGAYGSLFCEKCAATLEDPDEQLAHIRAAFAYEGAVRNALHALKYENKRRVGHLLGELAWDSVGQTLSEELPEQAFSKEKILLIPVPISKIRLRKRKYNQALLLAQGFASRDSGTFEMRTDVLYKIKDTESQVSVKDKLKRIENAKDCFGIVERNAVTNRTCVVLDDITTTGATLGEARKTLLSAGARKVLAMAVAH